MPSQESLHTAHIREIEQVGRGRPTQRDAHVVRSWLRCLDQYRLDPAQACEAYIVPDGRLREHRQQSEALIRIARSGLDHLFRQVAGQNYVLLLADRQGVTVEFLGDPAQTSKLRKAGLYLGSEWSEPRAGTCAVGACLETGEALTIHQTDHFDNTHTPLSCTAAPIYNADGELAAVLDISLLSSPSLKTSQNLALHLVNSTTRRIELANLMARTRNEWVLRFARSPEFLDVDPEAAISLDGAGRILGMTHSGAKLLARAAGLDWRQPAGLIGQPVTRFFDVQLDDLPQYTRGHAPQDRLIVARDGNALFAHAIEPNRSARGATVAVRGTPSALRGLDGGDARMAALQTRAAKLARQGLPILLQGETGVGKEYLARAIHEDSRRPGRFVAVNCAAIPESLIESELFGYLPGAYTGAAPKGRKGLIEEADGGTLFLDEIGDMPLALQSRLLRVLAESEVTPIGANAPRALRLALVSASHRDLGALVREGRFREDLYYRINAATLTVPALRERQDLDWLIARMLARHQDESGAPVLSPAALLALKAHAWPGNIRELANVIAVAAALCEHGIIEPADLPEALAPGGVAVSAEEATLRSTLDSCAGNVSEAARRLGLDRSTVHRQMRRYGLGARGRR
ncbi:sigma-54-dependent Fis family transcriptional regulator [Achromobacter sp. JUb104]|uniref:sigma-54-dependent Fis family transcriptional regulator n=1 Tax=Achromobacter sp. JUb104 TaxID=2940590 RepID=UPI00216A21A6|nr:sigma-54-dependent Fis family transcriptional regulator [Achromobacter sp. JUb104]MCS3507396.1 transcriptional regulator of acetoin/glycerol metabolism [Achromobacter sp. JUb104]